MLFFGILFNFIERSDTILYNSKSKNSKNSLFSDMCKNFQTTKSQRKNFKYWLLFDTTIDPFLLSFDLSEEAIQEIENWLEVKKEELIRQSKEER